jgi:hypothetical protein
VITVPETDQYALKAPGFILLSSGLFHHVGLNRLHVLFARALARQGICVLRFDMSGIGESAQRDHEGTPDETRRVDMKAAMDVLECKERVNTFVLAGLGSAADYAHQGAVADARVVGAIFLDGYCYPTLRYYLHRYGPFFITPRRWMPFVTRAGSERTNGESDKRPSLIEAFCWKRPSKDTYVTEMRALVQRGVNMLYVFSGGVSKAFNYEGQVFDSLRSVSLRDQVEVAYFPHCDHTFTYAQSREQLIARVSDWYQRRIGISRLGERIERDDRAA